MFSFSTDPLSGPSVCSAPSGLTGNTYPGQQYAGGALINVPTEVEQPRNDFAEDEYTGDMNGGTIHINNGSNDGSDSMSDDGTDANSQSNSDINNEDAVGTDSDETRSWFGPDQRRAGRGAARRNDLYRRQVEFAASMASEASSEGSEDMVQTSSQMSSVFSPRQKSGQDELLAVLLRLGRQMLRKKLVLVLQILVPLIFVAIAIVLWAIWGSETRPELQTVWYATSGYQSFFDSRMVRIEELQFCTIGIPGVPSFPPLPSCAFSGEEFLRDFCLRGGTQQGFTTGFPENLTLCVNWDRVSDLFTPLLANPKATLAGTFYLVMLDYFELIARRALVPVHSLDTMIAYQWAFEANTVRSAAGREKGFAGELAPVLAGLSPNTRHSALYSSGKLYFVGRDQSRLDSVIAYCRSISGLFPFIYGGTYSTMDTAKRGTAGERVWAYVEVKTMTPVRFDVVIHVGNYALPPFSRKYDVGYSGGAQPDTADLYLASGFATLQKTLSDYYVNTFFSADLDAAVYVAPMGSPECRYVPILETARTILCLIFALAFLFHMSVHVKQHVLEKELRIREAMLIMGLRQWTLYVADAIMEFSILFITSLISVFLLKVTFVTRSDAMIMFLVYFLFILTLIPLAGLIASVFSKARLAALVAPVAYFILVIPMFATADASAAFITGFSIFSPTAFAAAMLLILQHEASGGFTSRDFQSSFDGPTMSVLLGMLTADILIYYLLMLYLDAVLPKEWGTSKHPLFFILGPIRHYRGSQAKRLDGGPDGYDPDGVFEDLDHSSDVAVMDGLRKEYKRDGKAFVAVNNLYWGMRESEISVLLGHNGAGKTTVMNMMTGMIEPDEGDCYIYGHSVRQELSEVRQNLGFCPQHNILWPELTCRDHLEFFAQIKGLKGEVLEDAVCRVLYETDMLNKLDATSASLSGGMKRKLSIAIAFVGGSRLVFLDEPTAGLDVAARRHTWELLKRMSQSRTILLTTHYMDEADLLGHRIGIMSQGRLKCSGSGLFLKSKIGVGYSITVATNPESDPSLIDALVTSTVDGSVPLGRNGYELSYQLPKGSVEAFPLLLRELDGESARCGVRGYSLSATTLEEVFLKVSEHDVVGRNSEMSADAQKLMRRAWRCEIDERRWPTQFRAMLIKRFWNALRDRRMQCFQIVCPVVCILIAMLLTLLRTSEPTSLTLTFAGYASQGDSLVQTALCAELLGSASSADGAVIEETMLRTAQNLADYQLDTWYEHQESRYVSYACSDVTVQRSAAGALSDPTARGYVLFYNTSSKHSAAVGTAELYRQRLQHRAGAPVTYTQSVALISGSAPLDALSLLFVGILVMVPLTFLPSNPVAWVVKERECGARHLQDMAGLNYAVYWASNFVFDYCAYLVTVLLCVVIFAIFQRDEFVSSATIGGTFTLLIVYGFNTVPLAYAVSFLFNDHSSAQTTVMAVGFVVGFLMLMVVYVLMTDASTLNTSDALRWPFRLVPTYCIGEGILSLMLIQRKTSGGTANSIWDLNELGYPLIYMAAEVPVFVAIVLLADQPRIRRCFQRRDYDRDRKPTIPADEDRDVRREREGILSAQSRGDTSDVVRVLNLQKQYGRGKKAKLAVKGLSFSIFPGEVFGFLGTNGAGKTTTMSMLCQYFLPSGGEAVIDGNDLVDDGSAALQCIGFCPQFDATLDLLTVEEHLWLYARVHGVTESQREAVVEALIQLCELSLYRKVLSSKLSGGNRRKLSVAMSLVAGPKVVFLDEPSAGMDPVARRGLWTTIQRAAKRCCVVLTTHHLEEVEALADIVAIMVDGSLQCIGDKVHLKNKYGSGYEVSMRVALPENGDALEEFMAASFPGAILNERDDRRFVFQLPREHTFGDVFEVLQGATSKLSITDYSVSQTSIEQIFLQMSERGEASS